LATPAIILAVLPLFFPLYVELNIKREKPAPGTIKPPSDEIRQRIDALKQRQMQPEPDIKQFHYDPDQPLHLVSEDEKT